MSSSSVLRLAVAITAFTLAPMVGVHAKGATAVTPTEATAIARDAWLDAYAPVQGYQTLYSQTQSRAARASARP